MEEKSARRNKIIRKEFGSYKHKNDRIIIIDIKYKQRKSW
jgi:hypothetical protein